MEYHSGVSYRRITWALLYFAGCLVICIGSHLHVRSADLGEHESFVTKYVKEYPSLNNKWTIDGFVGNRKKETFKHVDEEFSRMTADAAILGEMMAQISPEASDAITTIDKIDEYLGRWKSIMYILQSVYEGKTNKTKYLPLESMRKAAAGQLKVLFTDASHELPLLLTRIDSQIRLKYSEKGQCLLCQFVSKKISYMTAVSESPIGLKMAVNESREFLSQLMKLQVQGTLLYDMTCTVENIKCRQKIVTLEKSLKLQNEKLSNCTPMLMTTLSKFPIASDVYFVNLLSNTVMYIPESKVLSSQRGKLDLTGANNRGLAMKCAHNTRTEKDPSVWTIEDASLHGRLGYFIRGKNDCYVGFDRSFLSFINTELDDPKAAGAENDEVLLCRNDPAPNRQTQTFTLEPVSASNNSAYKLRNVLTGKYLRAIRTSELLMDDTTGGHAVNLVLQLCDMNQLGCTWGITKEAPVCEDRPPTYTFMDMFIMKLYLLLMGVLFIMLVASLVVIWLYRKQIRRDYLQYRRVNTQEVIIPPSYRFPSRT